MTRLRLAFGACLSLVMAAAMGACTADAIKPLPPAPKVPETTTTSLVDYSAVGLGPAAPGRTTTTVKVGPGRASLVGSVTGPGGPLAGAVVRAERVVGESVATADVLTGADGTFKIPKVLGGRYRVRAWKPSPDNLAIVEPVVFFLEGSETKRVELTLGRFQGASVSAAIAPDPPLISTPTNLVVLVVDQSVDANGVVRSSPIANLRAEIFGSGDWRVLSATATTTDGEGKARWQVECRRVGKQPLSVVVGESAAFDLNLTECTVPPPTVEDTAPGEEPTTTTGGTSRSTTTTRPASSTSTTARPSTTSTTAADD